MKKLFLVTVALVSIGVALGCGVKGTSESPPVASTDVNNTSVTNDTSTTQNNATDNSTTPDGVDTMNPNDVGYTGQAVIYAGAIWQRAYPIYQYISLTELKEWQENGHTIWSVEVYYDPNNTNNPIDPSTRLFARIWVRDDGMVYDNDFQQYGWQTPEQYRSHRGLLFGQTPILPNTN